MSSRTALVSGATGFLGQRIVELLLSSGFSVRALSSGKTQRTEGSNQSVQWFGLTEHDLVRAVHGVECFFNCAVVYDRPHISDDLIREVNVTLPLRILEHLGREKGRITCVLGDTFFRNFPQDATRQPRYTRSKSELLERVHSGAATFSDHLRISFLQIEQVYGPGEAFTKVFPMLTSQLLQNVPRLALTEGVQRRDFIHVRDVASAALSILEAEWQGIIQVPCGSGESTSVRNVVERLKSLTASKTVLGFGDLPSDQSISDSKADIRLLSDWGWAPHIFLEDGLTELVADVRARLSVSGAST